LGVERQVLVIEKNFNLFRNSAPPPKFFSEKRRPTGRQFGICLIPFPRFHQFTCGRVPNGKFFAAKGFCKPHGDTEESQPEEKIRGERVAEFQPNITGV
jgi:hypothetical protein